MIVEKPSIKEQQELDKQEALIQRKLMELNKEGKHGSNEYERKRKELIRIQSKLYYSHR